MDDRFFALRDPNVLGAAPSNFPTISNTDLFDVSSNLVDDTNIADLEAKEGWYITLRPGKGEKVLGPSMTIDGVISFTTYTPAESAPTGTCVQPGVGRIYHVNLFNGNPTIDQNGDGSFTESDRDDDLDRPGIPPPPVPVFSDREIFECVGTECFPIEDGIKIESTYWRDS